MEDSPWMNQFFKIILLFTLGCFTMDARNAFKFVQTINVAENIPISDTKGLWLSIGLIKLPRSVNYADQKLKKLQMGKRKKDPLFQFKPFTVFWKRNFKYKITR